MLIRTVLFALALAWAATSAHAQFQTRAFTYQGRLDLGGAPYTGVADMSFQLWYAPFDGQAVGPVIACPGVEVDDGLFVVSLDVSDTLTEENRPLFLEITVTPPGGPTEVLSPRQPLTPAPLAFQAEGARVDSQRRSIFEAYNGGTFTAYSTPGSNGFTPVTSAWQAFLPRFSGVVEQIRFQHFKGINSPDAVRARLYEGIGVGGKLIAESMVSSAGPADTIQTIRWNDSSLLIARNFYTVELEVLDPISERLSISSIQISEDSFRPESNFGTQEALEGTIVTRTSGGIQSGVWDGLFFGHRLELAPFGVAPKYDFLTTIRVDGSRSFDPLRVDLIGSGGSQLGVRHDADGDGTPEDGWVLQVESDELELRMAAPGDRISPAGSLIKLTETPERLGIFDTFPRATFHVENRNINVQEDDLLNEVALFEDNDAVVGIYSDNLGDYGSALVLGEMDTGAVANKWGIARRTTSGNGELQFTFGSNVSYGQNPVRFAIRPDGSAFLQGALTQSSQESEKQSIETITGAIDTLLALRGVTYEWKSTGNPDIGFVAEEMAQVLPEIVGFDNEGNPIGIDYGRVTALLVEAVREQNARLDRLESRLNELSDRLE